MAPTKDFFAEALDYNPTSGVFTWKNRPLSHFQSERYRDTFNTLRSGKIAGTIALTGYVQIAIKGKSYLAHRIAWLLTHGQWPPNEVDHINGVRNDNRLENLRLATSLENKYNAKLRVDNTSGVKGVDWNKQTGMWRAAFRVKGKTVHVGYFHSIQQAQEQIRIRRQSQHREFSRH